MSMVIDCGEYLDGHRVRDLPLEDVSEVKPGPGESRLVWIYLQEPDEPLLRQVQEEFGLHDLAVEDAHRAHQRPKLEEYGEGLFIVLRTAQIREDGTTELGELHLFVGPHYLVAIRHGTPLSYPELRHRCERAPHLLRRGPGYVLYAFMDFVVDQYFPVIDALEEQIEQLEEAIFDGGSSRQLTERIYDLKRELLALKRAISPLIDVCNRLVRFEADLVPEDVRPYFRDVYDHVIRINENVDNLREFLNGAREANLSLISIGQNEVTKKLAAWAAIIAVPTMIAGVYGMNFAYMPELHLPLGYPVALAVMVALCGLLYRAFRRAEWL